MLAQYHSHSLEETQGIAAEIAHELSTGATLGLIGTLGAGKTAFVQGLAIGLGIEADAYVSSPTFALIHEYAPGRGTACRAPTLFHFDLYRLNHFEELIDIGFEDYTQKASICVLEWADMFPELRSFLTHEVQIEVVGEEERKITITATP